ncbi:MGH1-like glycoside hydrolase domain-containing protein [Streptomyces tauricus]|uniref:MGH1-like glycoside hydrolase domain-containing protein n=1 Tax=Streptomyces tauricus TaxID=68274 RepID=UPI0038B5A336
MDRTTQLTARPTARRTVHHDLGLAGTAVYDPAEPLDPVRPAESLHARAARVLDTNWTGTSTVPSRSLYPHQWSWDSAFIAIGLRHLSPLRAQTELETLLGAQWGDGRIPHIVFNPSVPLDAYFPSPDFWRSSTAGRTAGAPRTVQTSGIVQPPVHALAVWLVHSADPGLSRSRSFLSRMYPRLAAWHRYLLHRRDLGGGGLASVVHPWEQGMDNAPSWDAPLSRVTPAPARSFRRADLDHGAAEDRPTDLDYGRYVRLAADYRDGGYADGGAADGGHGAGGHGGAGRPGSGVGGRMGGVGGGGGGFAVEDPSFNALLIASEHALARIARELGATGTARHARAERLTAALVERLWDPAQGMFFCRDVRTDEPIPERGVSGLVPLILPTLPRETAATLVRTLRGPHFGLGDTTRLVPSYDLTGHAFDPHRYWRGPAWFNTNWLVERGLRLHGELSVAAGLRGALLETADTSGFAEYVDPYTGEACGALGFSWTAALTLDLLHETPRTPQGPDAAHGTTEELSTTEKFGEGALGGDLR